MAKATKSTKPTIERPQVQLSNDGAKNVAFRDALTRLCNEVIYPLQTLADLLTECNPDVATRELPQPTLEGIGWLIEGMTCKAEQILREHGLSEDED